MSVLSIATFNVNSIRARIKTLIPYLKEQMFDIFLLQEIKCQTSLFPEHIFYDLGYHCAIYGQKAYNGVAILSRHPLTHITYGIPSFIDESARFLMADINYKKITIRVASLYAPNGNPIDEKFSYKLTWYDSLYDFLCQLNNMPTILGGDYNIISEEIDAYHAQSFRNNALFHIESRKRLRMLETLGYVDTFRLINPKKNAYSYWDYMRDAFRQNKGLRIDYILASPRAIDYLDNCWIDDKLRSLDSPSDHTPVIAHFTF